MVYLNTIASGADACLNQQILNRISKHWLDQDLIDLHIEGYLLIDFRRMGREHCDKWLLVTYTATFAIKFPYFLTCLYSVHDWHLKVEEDELIRWLVVF